MSVLGDFVRLDPEVMEAVRADPGDAYVRLSDFEEAGRLDLGRAWETRRPHGRGAFPDQPGHRRLALSG